MQPGPGGPSPAVRDLLARVQQSEDAGGGHHEDPPSVLARRYFLVEAESRGGGPGMVRAGGVYLHDPTVAILLPSDFPPLARRRPGFAGLRHVLVRLSFMLDRLPPRHSYESARLIVTLDEPTAVVRAQRPDLVTTEAQAGESSTNEFSMALSGLVRVGADRTRTSETKYRAQQPVIMAENRGKAGFGWAYQAQDGAPLLPRVQFALAVVEMAGSVVELSGTLSAEAVLTRPRLGVLTSTRAVPAEPPVPFCLPFDDAAPARGVAREG